MWRYLIYENIVLIEVKLNFGTFTLLSCYK